jgi:hypothetical protein
MKLSRRRKYLLSTMAHTYNPSSLAEIERISAGGQPRQKVSKTHLI